MRIVLVEPEIPPNTGSIARMCAGMKTPLHLIRPLGFSLEDRYLKRAGLDYWPHVDLHVHENWEDFLGAHGASGRLWMVSRKAERPYTAVRYRPDDILVFGRETKGLGDAFLARYADRTVGVPITGNIRSYNLSNAVSVVFFEALRQTEPGLFPPPAAE